MVNSDGDLQHTGSFVQFAVVEVESAVRTAHQLAMVRTLGPTVAHGLPCSGGHFALAAPLTEVHLTWVCGRQTANENKYKLVYMIHWRNISIATLVGSGLTIDMWTWLFQKSCGPFSIHLFEIRLRCCSVLPRLLDEKRAASWIYLTYYLLVCFIFCIQVPGFTFLIKVCI